MPWEHDWREVSCLSDTTITAHEVNEREDMLLTGFEKEELHFPQGIWWMAVRCPGSVVEFLKD